MITKIRSNLIPFTSGTIKMDYTHTTYAPKVLNNANLSKRIPAIIKKISKSCYKNGRTHLLHLLERKNKPRRRETIGYKLKMRNLSLCVSAKLSEINRYN